VGISQTKGYSKYIGSDKWKKKRLERLAIDNNKCQTCHEDGTNYGLQVHHATYDRFGDEDMSDLITLCTQCHDAITNVFRARRDQGDIAVDVYQSERFTRESTNTYEFSYTDIQVDRNSTSNHAQLPTRQPFEQVRKATEGDKQQA